jgi:ribosomal-protein-alanine N-acetyltransferase
MLQVNFDPFPVLASPRLVLRRIDHTDAQQMFRLRCDPEAMRYIPRPRAKTIDDAKAHIDNIENKIVSNTGINWAITLKGNPEFIGIIGHFLIKFEHFRSEIGYMLLPEFHGKGIMSEAIATVMAYGFEVLGLHSVEAIVDPDNAASAKVLEKNGFVKEAHLRENEYFDGKFLDTVIYSKLNPYDIR